MIDYHSLAEINFYSSIAVFTMSVSSTYRQTKNKVSINWLKAFNVSLGSFLGRGLGSYLFSLMIQHYGSDTAQWIQIILTLVSLIIVLIYTIWLNKKLFWENQFANLCIGIFLGSLSTFLGVGGGPFTVTVLIFFFGLSLKESTVYSIITILFSQLAKIIDVTATAGTEMIDTNILITVILAALIGGYLGV